MAWYALVHMAAPELPRAVAGMAARLAPGGRLAMAWHLRPEVRHLSAWWDRPVDVDFALHHEGPVLHAVASSGLDPVESYARSPLVGVEAPTRRLSVRAQRPLG